mgnify:CR=1 FL=1|jgi:glycosyltransferase involved in cell wall biosynthesis
MKISIVIPVFNAENFIEDCIHSALNQTYENIEIIAVNDGSTDTSLSILNNFKTKITIIDQKNGGTASALNVGIKNMAGEWFKWLSADDLLKPNTIEKLVLEIKKLGKDAENCIIYSNYDLIDEKGDVFDTFLEPNYNSFSAFQRNVILLDHYYGNGTTSIMHKSIFEKCGFFDESLKFKDDYEFWMRCTIFFNYNLHLLPENLAQYRIHQNQLTKIRYDDALAKIKHMKSLIVNQLSEESKIKYLSALKQYQKKKSLKSRIRKSSRDLMFKILPNSISNKILEKYLNNKN